MLAAAPHHSAITVLLAVQWRSPAARCRSQANAILELRCGSRVVLNLDGPCHAQHQILRRESRDGQCNSEVTMMIAASALHDDGIAGLRDGQCEVVKLRYQLLE